MKTINDLVKEYVDARAAFNKAETVKGNLSRDIKAHLLAKGLKTVEVEGYLVTYEAPTVRTKIAYDNILLDYSITDEVIKEKYTGFIHVKDSIDVVKK